jgi:predicted nucleic acid-binding protein
VIIVDTNVLSEILKPLPFNRVLHWLAEQDPTAVFTTVATQAEILYGIEVLPPGKRRVRLSQAVEEMFAIDFDSRILPFDEAAAREFAKFVAARETAGRPTSQFDAMIAAIARSCQAGAIATRNTADFELCGLELINPWTA